MTSCVSTPRLCRQQQPGSYTDLTPKLALSMAAQDDQRLPTPPGAGPEPDDGLTPEERARRRALEYDEEELTGEMEQEREQMYQDEEKTYADVHLVNLPVPAGGKVWHARMPNFLEIRTKPFDSDEWDPKEEDLEANETDGTGEVKQRMVPDENVIRWRWTKDQLGEVVRPRRGSSWPCDSHRRD